VFSLNQSTLTLHLAHHKVLSRPSGITEETHTFCLFYHLKIILKLPTINNFIALSEMAKK